MGKSTLNALFISHLFPRPNTFDRAPEPPAASSNLEHDPIRLPPRAHRVRHRGLRGVEMDSHDRTSVHRHRHIFLRRRSIHQSHTTSSHQLDSVPDRGGVQSGALLLCWRWTFNRGNLLLEGINRNHQQEYRCHKLRTWFGIISQPAEVLPSRRKNQH